MWAMWANILKNFVRGPSAAVTFGARPYPGAIGEERAASEPGGHAAIGHRPSAIGQRAGRPAASEPGGRPVWPSAMRY